jgi:hypothetical protein
MKVYCRVLGLLCLQLSIEFWDSRKVRSASTAGHQSILPVAIFKPALNRTMSDFLRLKLAHRVVSALFAASDPSGYPGGAGEVVADARMLPPPTSTLAASR